VNYDDSLVVSITVTCYPWALSSGDDLFTCGTIYLPPQRPPTAYSRTDSECHTSTTVHISLTAWLSKPSYDLYACMPCTP